MGGCASKPEDPEAKALRERTNAIEKQLEESRLMELSKIKLLLLGAGESGKSTIFKQLRLMYGAPRSREDLKMFARVVKGNVTVLLKRLIPLVKSLELEGNFEENERAAYDKVLECISANATETYTTPVQRNQMEIKQAETDATLSVDLKEEIQTLFSSKTWETVWAERSTVNAIDSHMLFINELDAISKPNYTPTTQHILNARVRTTNAVKEEYDIDGQRFEIYDVGGQRSERKKWMPIFDGCDAVIFVAALSEYDQKLAEAKRMNRMIEALGLFKSIANHHAFTKAPILLFLNKKDLFEEKLLHSKIEDQKDFSDYCGHSYEDATVYFIEKYRDCFISEEESETRLFVHPTVATDTENVAFVWESCRNIILEQNLRECEFLN